MTGWLSGLGQRVAASPEGPLTSALHRLLFSTQFTDRRARRLLILYQPNRISYASVYPFLHYAEDYALEFDAEVRLFPVETALTHGLPQRLRAPTHVLAQAWLTDPPEKHAALAGLLMSLPAGTIKAFSDTFANADIRLAAVLPNLDLYFKKSLFVDTSEFLRPRYGHTNLTEYYGRLYDLEDETTDWHVPASALGKLRLAPNFLTDPGLLRLFVGSSSVPDLSGRQIDLHARLGGVEKSGWYGEMRRHAFRAVEALDDLTVATGTGVSRKAFMDELRQSKICFSPFGYGELCWRDIEAIAAGAVLLKPDMSHLCTAPDLYRDGETYVACRWDFSDVRHKVHALLSDDERRTDIATRAWKDARSYLVDAGPVRQYSDLFTAGAQSPPK